MKNKIKTHKSIFNKVKYLVTLEYEFFSTKITST